MSTSVTALRLLENRIALDRISADLAVVAHSSFVDALLDFVARTVVIFEPQAGAAEMVVSGLVGGLVAGTVMGIPLAGAASTLTLLVEKGVDLAVVTWARARIAAQL